MPVATRGGKLGQSSVSPAVMGIVGVVALIAVLCGVYFVVIKPGRDAAAAEKTWTTPEAAAARAPGARARPAGHEELLEQLRSKERGGAGGNAAPVGRSRRRDD